MSQEAVERTLVQRSVALLRLAKDVIAQLKDGNDFSEEPALTDLVMVAQVIGQVSVTSKMEDVAGGLERPTSPPCPQSLPAGEVIGFGVGHPPSVDIQASWIEDRWIVDALGSSPVFRTCFTAQELTDALMEAAIIASEKRLSGK